MSLLDEVFLHVTDDSYVCPLQCDHTGTELNCDHTGTATHMHRVGHSRSGHSATVGRQHSFSVVADKESKVKEEFQI